MAKGLVIYYSKSGNTKQMAEIIANSMNEADLATDCKAVEKREVDDLLAADICYRANKKNGTLPSTYKNNSLEEILDDLNLVRFELKNR